MATFYTNDGEECYEVQGSYGLEWGSPMIEEAKVPIDSDEPSRLLKKLYYFFASLEEQYPEIKKALLELDPSFYKFRNKQFYQNHEWYEFIASRNIEDDFFYASNVQLPADENGLVYVEHPKGYLKLDEDESRTVIDIMTDTEEIVNDIKQELVKQGMEIDEEIVEDELNNYIDDALRELDFGFGKGCTWYSRKSLDEAELIQQAQKINNDLIQTDNSDKVISDELLKTN